MPIHRSSTTGNLEQALLQSTGRAMPTAKVPAKLPASTPVDIGSRVVLPAVRRSVTSLDAVLRRRIATRHFASSGIDSVRLGTVLAGSELQPARRGSVVGGSVLLSLYVHVWRTPDIQPAYYIYQPEGHCLDYVSPAPVPSD